MCHQLERINKSLSARFTTLTVTDLTEQNYPDALCSSTTARRLPKPEQILEPYVLLSQTLFSAHSFAFTSHPIAFNFCFFYFTIASSGLSQLDTADSSLLRGSGSSLQVSSSRLLRYKVLPVPLAPLTRTLQNPYLYFMVLDKRAGANQEP